MLMGFANMENLPRDWRQDVKVTITSGFPLRVMGEKTRSGLRLWNLFQNPDNERAQ